MVNEFINLLVRSIEEYYNRNIGQLNGSVVPPIFCAYNLI